jgi:hypothetical protein
MTDSHALKQVSKEILEVRLYCQPQTSWIHLEQGGRDSRFSGWRSLPQSLTKLHIWITLAPLKEKQIYVGNG